jgi:oligoribonuclease NrnB/cAMP/cGMP phosphodiesterase (DHH superfamily)
MINDNFNMGIYFMIDSQISDFLNLKEIQKYSHLNKVEPSFNSRKMIYIAFDENKQLIEKRQLFYIKENNLKAFLSNYFNEPFIEKAHEVELCTKDDEYRKINLLINLPEFELKYRYTKKGALIQQFISNNSWLDGYVAVCPGFYSNIDVNSIYFLNSRDIEARSIETVEDLFAKTHTC